MESTINMDVSGPRRSSRTRPTPIVEEDSHLLPKKKIKHESIEDIYLQKSVNISNFKPSSLETIFESPKKKGLNLRNFMGLVKFKRQCKFPSYYDPPKLKKKHRKDKAGKLKRLGICVPSGKRVSIEQVKKALDGIMCGENDQMSRTPFDATGIQINSHEENWLNNGILESDVKDLTNDMSSLNVCANAGQAEREPLVLLEDSPELQELNQFAPIGQNCLNFSRNKRRMSRSRVEFSPYDSKEECFELMKPRELVSENPETRNYFNEVNSIMSISAAIISNDDDSDPNTNLPQKRKKKAGKGIHKKTRGRRRDSGLHRPTYSSHSPDDSPTLSPSENCDENSETLQLLNNFSSPLNDPTFDCYYKPDRKSRRRSARLGDTSKQGTLGSLWNTFSFSEPIL